MSFIEFCWLTSHSSYKGALQELLGCSGQLLKKHLSSKELQYSIKEKSVSRIPIDIVNNKKINPLYIGPEVKVITERENYLVLHKPAFSHSHPLQYSDTDTLLNYLAMNNIDVCLQVNKENYDRGLIYRLDYETSGLMIVAKTEEFYQKMRSNFNGEMKSKFYLAIVEGKFTQDGFHSHGFKASGGKGSKQKVVDSHSPNDAIGELEVRLVSYQNNYSLVLVNLHSGLRHQIRAQLAHLGFPILGDTLYGAKSENRLFLHAYRYEFDSIEEDLNADLFDGFFDLNSSFQMCHDMIRIFNRR